MKQIIVNVSELSAEEKQRVNEALAKIIGVRMCNPPHWGVVATMYGPSFDGANVGWDYDRIHTPQQVLEMAGMAENRKVRADFDPKQPISVDVTKCTDDEKEEVQQAFFDVGLEWFMGGTDFKHLSAESYTNRTVDGSYCSTLMFGIPHADSISHRQFLELVYEPEQQGHVHAENMALYAEDALTHPEPWKLWQIKAGSSDWISCKFSPAWDPRCQFRRKPKTHIVHGVEVPAFDYTPKAGDRYYVANVGLPEFFENGCRS